MDRARIEEEVEKIYGFESNRLCFLTGKDLIATAEHIAAIARNEALEQAAIVAWIVGMDEHDRHQGLPHDCREVGSAAAKAIRALKESK